MGVSPEQWQQLRVAHGEKSVEELIELVKNEQLSIGERFAIVLLYEGNDMDVLTDEVQHELAQDDAYMQREVADFLGGL